jgi:hypothetical protein
VARGDGPLERLLHGIGDPPAAPTDPLLRAVRETLRTEVLQSAAPVADSHAVEWAKEYEGALGRARADPETHGDALTTLVGSFEEAAAALMKTAVEELPFAERERTLQALPVLDYAGLLPSPGIECDVVYLSGSLTLRILRQKGGSKRWDLTKAAASEIRHLRAVRRHLPEGWAVPLCALLDYRGFTGLVAARLPRDCKVVVSAGMTTDATLAEPLVAMGIALNLRSVPKGIMVHESRRNLTLSNVSALFPREHTRKGRSHGGKRAHRLLRPELVAMCPTPIDENFLSIDGLEDEAPLTIKEASRAARKVLLTKPHINN